MQNESFLKCPCEHCGANIEFPAEGLGQSLPCPHCLQNTQLRPSAPETLSTIGAKKSKRPMPLMILGCIALLGAMAFGIFAAKRSAVNLRPESAMIETNLSTETAVSTEIASPNKQPTKRARKVAGHPVELNNFEAAHVALEKSSKGRLIYASGIIRNKTDRQRFGVKVELGLFDARDVKLSSTTDYAQIIEPRKEWKFRALVTEPEAVRVQVTSITEE